MMIYNELRFDDTWYEVIFTGSDGKQNSKLVEGTSLYVAAFHALEQVARSWWSDPAAAIMVRALKQVAEYQVDSEAFFLACGEPSYPKLLMFHL
jgi:hypothetical protein